MQKLDHLGWVVDCSYKIGDKRFGVRTTSYAFAEWLDYALAAYRVKRKEDPYFSVVIADSDGSEAGQEVGGKKFHILYKGVTTAARTLDVGSIGRSFLAELEALSFRVRDDAIFLDATVVASGQATALLPTSVAHVIAALGGRVKRAGLSIPEVRMVAVDRGSGRVIPIPRQIEMPDDALQRLEVLIPDGGRTRRGGPTSEAAIDVVMWPSAQVAEEVLPLTRGSALHRLAGSAYNLDTLKGDALDGLGRLVGNSSCYQLTSGTAQEMLEQVAGLLKVS